MKLLYHLTDLFKDNDSFRNESSDFISESFEPLIQLFLFSETHFMIHSEIKPVPVYISLSLTHSFNRFIQRQSFIEEWIKWL